MILWAIFLAGAVVLPCTAIAQPADYRVAEASQACDLLEMVHTSAENAKRGIGALALVAQRYLKEPRSGLLRVGAMLHTSFFARSRVVYAAGS